MRKRKTVFEDLIKKNKEEIMADKKQLDKLEDKLVEKLVEVKK
ncbi:FbpB family small basic protein [Caldibacillus lycopersici]|uniref:FbpB family small basic protein n=1 Tax=Perspicuibacillus lycopersici TaxID=1325689 RepID=A0AAE3ISG0_9BACI|nr:FbpB family small basic protein [Perspicuibacillus lycopersici]MCU9613367.1 FbpB family small basic protein [Perspicuibacillus lycopersici]